MKKFLGSKYFKIFFWSLASLIILGSLYPKINADSGEKNLYVYQADAFLHGQLDITQYHQDVAIYNGRIYVPFPPFPALLLLPFVAILGVASTKVMFVSIALSILSVFLLMQILKKLDIDLKYIPWIVASFFLGTGYWSAVLRSSSVWFFAHVVSVTCMFLAINEAFGKGRGLLIGFFLGLAFLSRQLSIYFIFFLFAVLLVKPSSNTRKLNISNVLGFVVVLGFCISVYLVFNWMRFENIFDTGYSYISLPGFLKERVEKYGMFNIVYVPFNFLYMFLQGFHVEFSSPTYLSGISMDPFGTAITFASPFVFFAFFAKWKKSLLLAAWFSVGLSLTHMLLYYNNGYVQANTQRFSLDFLPVLILLIGLGIKRIPEYLWKSAIIYSIALNVFALTFVFLGMRGY
jgi:4-amino-4-deoxy-L-arabinose transferase-like glycosyltransferase